MIMCFVRTVYKFSICWGSCGRISCDSIKATSIRANSMACASTRRCRPSLGYWIQTAIKVRRHFYGWDARKEDENQRQERTTHLEDVIPENGGPTPRGRELELACEMLKTEYVGQARSGEDFLVERFVYFNTLNSGGLAILIAAVGL